MIANDHGLLIRHEINRIRESVIGGKTLRQVAHEMDRSLITVFKYTRDLTPGYYLSDDIKRKINLLLKSGKTIRETAEELNISESSVFIN